MASLDTVPLTGPGAQSFGYGVGVPGGGVQAFKYTLASGPSSEASLVYSLIILPTYCWDSRAQRLLDYLGKPFNHLLSSLMGTWMRTVARELSSCTEVVTLTGTPDARGTGNFTFEVRFEPVTAVTSAQRIDANGAVLETYAVVGISGRLVTVTGVTSPRQGDRLLVTYTYTHEGLDVRIGEALAQLNILTAGGEFLDKWGTLFNVLRMRTGKYSSLTYGAGNKYGTSGVESDGSYSRRIIATVLASRNSKVAIIAAVQKLTGGSPYIVEWNGTQNHRAFIFRPTGAPAWAGQTTDTATQNHLIWGMTARFVSSTTVNGGAFVFEVWVPKGSGYSTSQLLAIVNGLKPAGSKAFIRYF